MATPIAPRALPRFPEPDTEPFWEATKAHELTYQVCDACAKVVFFPRRHCVHCLGTSLTRKVSKGEGTLYSYSVVRQNRDPRFEPLGAYAVAWVDLDEGFRLLTNVVGVDDLTTGLRIGQRVRVEWQDQGEGLVSLPLFRPA